MSAELLAQIAVLGGGRTQAFDLKRFCFKEQLEFISDRAQYKTAVCSRRAGKTIACAADLIDTALRFPGVVCLYITLSRKNAKRIIWPELLKINREFQLGGHPNETDLSIKFPNESIIYATGAKDKTEIENFRGLPIKKVYVDECQSFRAYIEDLIDDVLTKALYDYAGTLCLIGTPGLVPAGYFYNSTQSKAWKHYSWTMFQNPYLEKKSGKSVMELVNADCERMGVGHDSPKIQRECYGRWIPDTDALIFKYQADRNHFDSIPAVKGKWETVIGVDLGFDDSDAIAVIAWHEGLKEAYLIHEDVTPKQGITELAAKIEALVKEHDPLKIVMDTGGLGKKISEELQKRFGLPIEAAEKSRKMEFIEILNDSMRTGKFYAHKASRFAQDCQLVERDRDKSTVDRIVISDNYHSDICDAVLYAFREALHWLYEPVRPQYRPGTPAWQRRQEEEMEKAAANSALGRQGDDPWEGMGWE
jgi:hypothetical protein